MGSGSSVRRIIPFKLLQLPDLHYGNIGENLNLNHIKCQKKITPLNERAEGLNQSRRVRAGGSKVVVVVVLSKWS